MFRSVLPGVALFLFSGAVHGLLGQATADRKLLRDVEKKLRSWEPAWEYAIQVLRGKDVSPLGAYFLGVSYYALQKWDSARMYLRRAAYTSQAGTGDVPREVWLLLGYAYTMHLDWDSARMAYLRYRNSLNYKEYLRKEFPREAYIAFFRKIPPTPAPQVPVENVRALVDKLIRDARTGKQMMESPVSVTIQNLGEAINTPYPEYGPVITADNQVLYFTGRRPDGINPPEIVAKDGLPYEDIFYSEWNAEDSSWTKARPMSSPINTEYHESILTISVDRRMMILYRDENGGDLYISYYRRGKWTRPEPLPEPVNSPYAEKSAAFSPDGKKLYFVSDRPGGLGGLDIWVTERLGENRWSEPINLGPPINTPYDEDGIFLHPDGRTLYFSSRGHNTMGGFDIFKAVLQEDGTWSEPENLGFPVNSPGDDIFFVVSSDGSRAYFSSSREGSRGSMDIFVIQLAKKQKPRGHFILLQGLVVDAETQEPLEAYVLIVDNKTGDTLLETTTDPATGEYVASAPLGHNIGVYIEAEGYLFFSENINMPDTFLFRKIFMKSDLQPIRKGASVALRNIFFEFGSAELLPESYTELDRVVALLNRYPGLVVEIAGHTDSIGSEQYNLRLSQRRADAVRNYLISKGISPARLIARGYGESQPIADNSTEEGRALNRRVEIRVLRAGDGFRNEE